MHETDVLAQRLGSLATETFDPTGTFNLMQAVVTRTEWRANLALARRLQSDASCILTILTRRIWTGETSK